VVIQKGYTMTNTYTWGLQSAPLVAPAVDGLTNVIVAAHWTYDAVDPTGKYREHRYGEVQLAAASPASFTPFASVTAAMLYGWIAEALGDQVAAMQTSMDAKIAAQIAADANPATPIPMPLTAS
jgi:hypothetical protein